MSKTGEDQGKKDCKAVIPVEKNIKKLPYGTLQWIIKCVMFGLLAEPLLNCLFMLVINFKIIDV